MIVILSDTHDNESAARAAIDQIRILDPQVIVHCGDLESPHMLELFRGLPLKLSLGNCDWDVEGIRAKGRSLKITDIGFSIEFEVAEKRCFVHHGDNPRTLARAIDSGAFHYVFHGHSHARRDERIGTTRVINPGALYRSAEYTYATLDPVTDELKFYQIEK